jgi:transporter family-2 protein
VLVALSLRPQTRRLLGSVRRWDVPWWTRTAGLGGAIVVLAGAATVGTLGVAVFSIAYFSGQITFGVVVDRFGIAPGGRRPVTSRRAQATVVALVAVVITQAGRSSGDIAPGLIAFAAAGGAATALQSAFNASIAARTGDAMAATALNVAVGAVAIVAVVAVQAGTGHLQPLHWPAEPWLYVGGVLGFTIVVSLAVASAAIGVLRTTLAMLAAQMTGALVLDWIVEDEPPTARVLTGVVLIVLAVTWATRERGSPGTVPPPPSAPAVP